MPSNTSAQIRRRSNIGRSFVGDIKRNKIPLSRSQKSLKLSPGNVGEVQALKVPLFFACGKKVTNVGEAKFFVLAFAPGRERERERRIRK